MLTRRESLNVTLGTSAALAFDRAYLSAQRPMIMRAIPSSGEEVPNANGWQRLRGRRRTSTVNGPQLPAYPPAPPAPARLLKISWSAPPSISGVG
jgi:hypothetical protein